MTPVPCPSCGCLVWLVEGAWLHRDGHRDCWMHEVDQ